MNEDEVFTWGLYARAAAVAAVAAASAYALAAYLPITNPAYASVPAALTALIAARAAVHAAVRDSVLAVVGAILGAVLAVGVVWVVPPGSAATLLLAAASFAVAAALPVRFSERLILASSTAVSAFVVLGSSVSQEFATDRAAGVLVGAGCALVASWMLSPSSEKSQFETSARTCQARSALLLATVADTLSQGTPSQEQFSLWREAARDERDEVLRLRAALHELDSAQRWSWRVTRADVLECEQLLNVADVTSLRVLSLIVDMQAGLERSDLPEAMRLPLSELVASASTAVAESGSEWREDAALATLRAAEQTQQLASVAPLLGHLRRINDVASTGEEEDDTGRSGSS